MIFKKMKYKEFKKNNDRYKKLRPLKKDIIDALALNEFNRPISERKKPSELLDLVEKM